MAAGGLLVFLYVLSDFGAVAILRYDTLTRAIFTEYRSNFFDRAPAAVLGIVLVVLTLLAIVAERRLRGRAAASRSAAGVRPATARAARGLALAGGRRGGGGRRSPASACPSACSSTGRRSDRAAPRRRRCWPRPRPRRSGSRSRPRWWRSALAVPVAVLAVRHRSRFTQSVETLAVSGYALPGLVVALALVFFASRYLPALYQTLGLVVVAYVVRFLPEALGSVRSSLVMVDPALEEAGRSLGRSRASVLATVTLPLVWRGLAAGGALVFLTAMKELPATLLLRPAGHDTLAVRVWVGAAEGFYAQAAPAALLLVAVSALVLWPLHLRARRHRAGPRGGARQ